MEDKELQELFDAKRTVEANRRRQEALRRMLEADGAAQPARRKTRPLWPVWTGAAAAAVALLLITLPALFGSHESAPTLTARTEVPEVVPEAVPPQAAPEPDGKQRSRSNRSNLNQNTQSNQITQNTQIIQNTPSTQITQSTQDTQIAPAPPVILDSVAPTPRVMRRESTLLACTEGCKAPEGTAEASSRNVQITFFNNDNYADATIHTISINK